eukprot:5258419-Ditylum_brightwellii.AAC.1
MNREQQQNLVENKKEPNHHHDSSKSTTDTYVSRPTLFTQQPNTWTDPDGTYQPRHTDYNKWNSVGPARLEFSLLGL